MLDLGRIQIVPRLRTGWEAIDLGFTLARSWYRPLFLSWLIPSLTLLIFLTPIFYLMGWELWIPSLIVWWLKPLWDSGPLLMGSRALFGEQMSVGQTIRNSWNYLRPDWFSWLTWRRFSPARSMVLSVTGLERLSGKDRSRRIGLLHQRSGSNGIWLTLACLFIEGVFFFGTMALVMLLVPESMGVSMTDFTTDESMINTLAENLLTALISACVAPFYTMAGFALYINRRIELEAWDIEIRFRDMVARQEQKRSAPFRRTAAQVTIGLMLTGLLSTGILSPANADSTIPESVSREQAQELVKEVMEDDVFHDRVTDSGWRLKEQPEHTDEKIPNWFLDMLEWVWDNIIIGGMDARSGIALALEVLIWLIAAGGIIWLIYHYRAGIRSVFSSLPEVTRSRKTEAPEVLFGLDVRQESLPDDVPSEAEALWKRGEIRAAVSLLYRATLSELIHRHNFDFHPGYTERECAALVNQSAAVIQPLNDFVQNLTEQWQLLAYGHREPPKVAFDHLCTNWREAFPS